jgi:hypothetical protein
LSSAGLAVSPELAAQTEPLRRVGVLLRLVHLDAAAAALGMGHGDVGPAQKRFSIGRVVRRDGQSGAGLQDQLDAVQEDRRGELRREAAGGAQQLLVGPDAGQQHRELVAADPGDERAWGVHGPAQPDADLDQQPVPGGVAEGVVQRAEAVEVEQHQRHPARSVADRLAGGPEQRAPVGQPGERVPLLVADPLAGDPPGGVQHRQRHREQRQQLGGVPDGEQRQWQQRRRPRQQHADDHRDPDRQPNPVGLDGGTAEPRRVLHEVVLLLPRVPAADGLVPA